MIRLSCRATSILHRLLAAACLLASGLTVRAADPSSAKLPEAKASGEEKMKAFLAAVPPTLADVPYGPHPKQVLHFWKADTREPAPLLFYIHGGGWNAGDRSIIGATQVKQALADGMSVVSVEYRFISEAKADGVHPPVKAPMHDAARALQFVRGKAKEWNLDKTRVGASGSSAGACTSLWLAFHDDLADPTSTDPVARESTRLTCAAVKSAQTSLDPRQMREWIPNVRYGGHAHGGGGDFFDPANREALLPSIRAFSPYEHVTADDPPVYLYYPTPPRMGEPEKDATHAAAFGLGLQRRCEELKVPCEFVYPGAPDVKHADVYAFLKARLKPAGKS